MMAKEPISNFEIPAEMRDLAEKSVTQAKQAFESFITAAQQAVTRVEGQAAARAGASGMSKKAMTFAHWDRSGRSKTVEGTLRRKSEISRRVLVARIAATPAL